MYDFHAQISEGAKSCIQYEELERANRLWNKFSAHESEFKERLQRKLKEIRGGRKDISELEALLIQVESSEFSPRKMDEEIIKSQKVLLKVQAVLQATSRGVKYCGKNGKPLIPVQGECLNSIPKTY